VTALFFYVGTLFPVLGFMNAYGMRYSFVWDHWVYLSALGIIALVAALVVRVAESLRTPAVVYGFAAIVLPVLALLTWRQAGMYTDKETLWRDTLVKNPDCWMAHNNLGHLLRNQGHIEEAMEHYQKAIQINPNDCEVLNNLGNALADKGRFDEAIENFRQAIRINPNFSEALDNLGIVLAAKGRLDEAIDNYRQAIKANSNRPETFFHLGMTLHQLGRTREAIAQYREALRLNPNLTGPLNNLAWVLAAGPDAGLRNGAEAVRLAEHACELTHYGDPMFIGTLAAAYAEAGRFDDAVATAQKARTVALAKGEKEIAAQDEQLLELFKSGQAYH
jgi:Flp pilus assembly protein TadD